MIEDHVVKAVTDISNARIKKNFPLLDKHFDEAEVRVICEAMYDLYEKILEKEKK